MWSGECLIEIGDPERTVLAGRRGGEVLLLGRVRELLVAGDFVGHRLAVEFHLERAEGDVAEGQAEVALRGVDSECRIGIGRIEEHQHAVDRRIGLLLRVGIAVVMDGGLPAVIGKHLVAIVKAPRLNGRDARAFRPDVAVHLSPTFPPTPNRMRTPMACCESAEEAVRRRAESRESSHWRLALLR